MYPAGTIQVKTAWGWRWLLLAPVPVGCWALLMVANCFLLDTDVCALRNALLSPQDYHLRAQFHASAPLLSLARTTLMATKVDPKYRNALRALHTADVGVYHCDENAAARVLPQRLAEADRSMSTRGWEKLVAVTEPGHVVLVYADFSRVSSTRLKLCYAAMEGNEIVVGTVQGDIKPLLPLLEQERHRLLLAMAR